MACSTPVVLVRDEVETSEGLARESESLRRSFADHGAFQCGFCTPGQVVHATALLRQGIRDRERVRHALSGNICRCTGYQAIVDCVVAAAEERT